MKNLIGRKIKGFKFEDEHLFHLSEMDKHIGEIGEIISVFDSAACVKFKNNYWHYPLDQIEQHLVEEESKEIFEKSKEVLRKHIIQNKEQVKEELQRLRELSEPEETIEQKISRLENELAEAKKEKLQQKKTKYWIIVFRLKDMGIAMDIQLSDNYKVGQDYDFNSTIIDVIEREY